MNSNNDRMIEITNLSENKVRSAVENMIEMGLVEAVLIFWERRFIVRLMNLFNMCARQILIAYVILS